MTSSDIVPSILITHQILNIIQGGVVQHVPQSAKAGVGRRKRAGWLALRRRLWMTQITKEFVSLCSMLSGILRLFLIPFI